jgi:TM2 domain-containing membrane protein YozV
MHSGSVPSKKALVAAALSTVLPGAGKLYAGKTKTFFLTFLLNAAYAAQTYESSKKLGIYHPLSIVNATAFAVFYLANIYGSYHSVIDMRKERKKQFLEDAARFYN